MTLSAWDELEPDHATWCAVEECPEHEDSVRDKRGDDGNPRAIPHDSVGAATWCEELEVLQENRHLYQEAERTVYDLRGVRPLRL